MMSPIIGRLPIADGTVNIVGSQILSGSLDPTPAQGRDGDFYYNPTGPSFAGPKTNGLWPAPVAMGGATLDTRRRMTLPVTVTQPGVQVLALPVSNPDYVELYRNGQLLKPSSFSLGNKLVVVSAQAGADVDDVLQLAYAKSVPGIAGGDSTGGTGGTTVTVDPVEEIPAGAINNSNKVFQLSKTPLPNTLNVFINGLRIDKDQYMLNQTTLTVNLPPDMSITATYYFYNVQG